MRSSSRSSATRASARASGAPGQVWIPRPKAMCCRAFDRAGSKVLGSVNRRGSRLAAAWTTISVEPDGTSTPPRVTGSLDSRKSPLTGLSKRSASSMKLPTLERSARSSRLDVRAITEDLQGGTEQPHGGLLTGRIEVGRNPGHIAGIGHRAVGEGRRGHLREHVTAGVGPTVLDVGDELVVEVFQRRLGQALTLDAADSAAVVRRRAASRRGTRRDRRRARPAGRR